MISLASQMATDLARIAAGPESIGETVTYTPKTGTAATVTGIPGADSYRVEEREDGTVRIRSCQLVCVRTAITSPQLYDTVTRADGSKWSVVGIAPDVGQVVLTLEDHAQVEAAQKGFRLR